MMTELVNMRDYGMDGVVRVDRASKFGNPYRMEKHGGSYTRQEAVENYREWFYEKIENDEGFRNSVQELRGEVLGCWCKPKLCHGDVILEYLEECVEGEG